MKYSKKFQSKDKLRTYKTLTCLIPFLFCLIVYFTDNVDYGGIFETGKYSSVALYWMGEFPSYEFQPTRLPGYPTLIYLVFKIFWFQ